MNDQIIYKYLSFKDGLRVLFNKSIKFSRPTDFNDPFDCYYELLTFNITEKFINDQINKGILVLDDYEKSLTKIQLINHLKKVYTFDNEIVADTFKDGLNQVWISCFSKIYDEVLMWSHYGDMHKGVCIGFNLKGLSETFDFIPSKVIYKKDFKKVDYCLNATKAMEYLISCKSLNWKYEKEIRLRTNKVRCSKMSDEGIVPIVSESISQIIFGCNCNFDFRTLQERLLRRGYQNIKLIKLKKSTKSFGFDEVYY